jgi:hypothetical protein
MLIHHKLMAIRAPLTERNLRQYSSSKLQFHGDFAAIECMSGCCLLPVGIQGIHSARSYVLAQAFGCRSFSAAGMNASCCPNWGSHMSACTMLGSNGAQIDHTSKQGHSSAVFFGNVAVPVETQQHQHHSNWLKYQPQHREPLGRP